MSKIGFYSLDELAARCESMTQADGQLYPEFELVARRMYRDVPEAMRSSVIRRVNGEFRLSGVGVAYLGHELPGLFDAVDLVGLMVMLQGEVRCEVAA